MKALGYEKAHALDAFAITPTEAAEPRLPSGDLLVEVHAIGIDPGEAAIRRTRVAVDHRVVAKIPDGLASTDADGLTVGS